MKLFHVDNRVANWREVASDHNLDPDAQSYQRDMFDKKHWVVFKNSEISIGIHVPDYKDALHVRGVSGDNLPDYIPEIVELTRKSGLDTIKFATDNERILKMVSDSGLEPILIGNVDNENVYKVMV